MKTTTEQTYIPPVYLIRTRQEAWLLMGAVCTAMLLIVPAMLTSGGPELVLWTSGAWAWYAIGKWAVSRWQLHQEVKSFRQELETIDKQ